MQQIHSKQLISLQLAGAAERPTVAPDIDLIMFFAALVDITGVF